MFPASVKGAGTVFATPDVCLVPPIPVPTPFPNTGMCANAIPATCTKLVFITNLPVLHIGSVIAMTSGDEPGVATGVASGTVKGPSIYQTASAVVFVEGSPIVTMLKQTGQNGMSPNIAPGMQVAPSQPIVFIGK